MATELAEINLQVAQESQQPRLDLIPLPNLSEPEQALFGAFMNASDGIITNYDLMRRSPAFVWYSPNGVAHIVQALEEKLRPLAESLNLPPDLEFARVNALGIVAGSEEEFSKLTVGEKSAQFIDRIIRKIKDEVRRDFMDGSLDQTNWKSTTVNGRTLHLTDINLGNPRNGTDISRAVSILETPELNSPVVAVIRTSAQIAMLDCLITNGGYMDEDLPASLGEIKDVRGLIKKINEAFYPELGRKLIQQLGKVSKGSIGYGINGDSGTRVKMIENWLGLDSFDIDSFSQKKSDMKIPLKKTEPYLETQRDGIGIIEHRSFEDRETSFVMLHLPSFMELYGKEQRFSINERRPFLLIAKSVTSQNGSHFEKKVALEISEGEAAVIQLFGNSSEVNLEMLGFNHGERERIRLRYLKFLDSARRLNIPMRDVKNSNRSLKFPEFINVLPSPTEQVPDPEVSSIEAVAHARMNEIDDCLHLSTLNLDELLRRMPEGKILLQRSPQTEGLVHTTERAEARELDDINVYFVLLHIQSYIREFRIKEAFEQIPDKPFILIVEALFDRDDLDSNKFKRIAFEISEAEAAVLLLFRESSEVNLEKLELTDNQRLMISDQYRVFLDRLTKIGIQSQGGVSELDLLKFPRFTID